MTWSVVMAMHEALAEAATVDVAVVDDDGARHPDGHRGATAEWQQQGEDNNQPQHTLSHLGRIQCPPNSSANPLILLDMGYCFFS